VRARLRRLTGASRNSLPEDDTVSVGY